MTGYRNLRHTLGRKNDAMAVRHGGLRTNDQYGLRLTGSLPHPHLQSSSSLPRTASTLYAHFVAGYSGTPLVRKLGIRPGSSVWIQGAPPDLDLTALLRPLPADVKLTKRASSRPRDMVLLFSETRRECQQRLSKALGAIDSRGIVWVIWPKKSSARFQAGAGDLTEDVIRGIALAEGVVDVKVCAVDDTWSGLKLVYRVKDR